MSIEVVVKGFGLNQEKSEGFLPELLTPDSSLLTQNFTFCAIIHSPKPLSISPTSSVGKPTTLSNSPSSRDTNAPAPPWMA